MRGQDFGLFFRCDGPVQTDGGGPHQRIGIVEGGRQKTCDFRVCGQFSQRSMSGHRVLPPSRQCLAEVGAAMGALWLPILNRCCGPTWRPVGMAIGAGIGTARVK